MLDTAFRRGSTGEARRRRSPKPRATNICIRAEIRAGELLREMKERGERQKAGDSDGHTRRPTIPTLPDLGITKSQSSRWQTLAALPEKQREEKITKATRKAVSGRSRGVAQDPRVSKSQN